MNQALQWVEDCASSHPSCKDPWHAKFKGRYPARFIDVGRQGALTVRIIETTREDFHEQKYTTLSYCWGNSIPSRLLLENYDSRLIGFAVDELPRTFQEAILVTRKLNVQFLWIDSLCIIQNSAEDWAAESAKMRFVYQNTYLNLAAAVSPNSEGGLFRPRYPLSFVPWVAPRSNGITVASHYTGVTLEKERFVLNTRGWILQEQALAPRTLIFGAHELYWQCHSNEASECRPDGTIHFNDPDVDMSAATQMGTTFFRLRQFSRGELPYDSEREKVWALLVEEYSRRRLTMQSDKLIAISGLAEELSKGWSGITYHAGLWSYCFRQNLLWTCLNVEDSRTRNTNVPPSWSWASLNAECRLPQTLPEDYLDSLADVLEVTTTPQIPTHLFGQVSEATVRIKGPLLPAMVRYENRQWVVDMDEGANTSGNQPNSSPLGGIRTTKFQGIYWDEAETQNLATSQPALFYLAPLQTQYIGRSIRLDLRGLLLRPASKSPRAGKFERLGVFTIGQWLSESDMERMFEGNKERPLFYNRDELFPQRTGGFEKQRTSLLRSDPYLNGPLNTNLKTRYSHLLEPREDQEIGPFLEKLKDCYSSELDPGHNHEVVHFLMCLELSAQRNRESDNPDKNLRHDEGNGFYIYELV